MSTLNNAELKDRERKTWALVAEGWRRQDELLREGAAPVTNRMLELAKIGAGHSVLDIASGTGEPAISAAQLVGAGGRVIGTDLIDNMLAFAREKAAQANLDNIEFHCVDGEELTFDPAAFDAVTMRWGLMFMPEPEACLKRVHSFLKEGGRVVTACWAAPDRNPFVMVAMQVLGKYMELPKPPPGTPGIFSFADADRLHRVLESSGFGNIEIEEMEIDVMEVEDGAAYWSSISDLAGPVMMLVNQLDEDTRAKFERDVIETADAMKQGESLKMSGTTWIASGIR
ncbi:MAG: class I SAM-dependent methyltransferase [Gammaproteobacteria bacterium]|nr:class I SAM-dependent methyltransferase [Gammaproteobacteria bacterium]